MSNCLWFLRGEVVWSDTVQDKHDPAHPPSSVHHLILRATLLLLDISRNYWIVGWVHFLVYLYQALIYYLS